MSKLSDVECWERGLPDSIDRAMEHEKLTALRTLLNEYENTIHDYALGHVDCKAALAVRAKVEGTCSGLLDALRIAVRQNEHDMLMTGEELRACRAAIALMQPSNVPMFDNTATIAKAEGSAA